VPNRAIRRIVSNRWTVRSGKELPIGARNAALQANNRYFPCIPLVPLAPFHLPYYSELRLPATVTSPRQQPRTTHRFVFPRCFLAAGPLHTDLAAARAFQRARNQTPASL